MKCIYCNCQNDLTVSDIIPYGITGAKLKKAFVCKTHNAFTNDHYEKRFIDDMSFFRSNLGFSTREGKPIKYNADLSFDGIVINDTMLSNRESLYDPVGDVVPGKNKNGDKLLLGSIENLRKIKNAKITPVEIDNVTLHKKGTSEDFIGYNAAHTIARIAYEWHCYINDIEEYRDAYHDIVDYILDKNSNCKVEVVVDNDYYKAIDMISEVGTNTVFEYDNDDGYRCVIFDLWKTIAYKVKIGKSRDILSAGVNPITNTVCYYQYHSDGSKSDKCFAVQSQGNNKINIYSSNLKDVNAELWQFFVCRINKIMTTISLSIQVVKSTMDEFKSDLIKYDEGALDFAHLIQYEENRLVLPLMVLDKLFELNEAGLYNEKASFKDNIKIAFGIADDNLTMTKVQKEQYLLELKKLDDTRQLSKFMHTEISFFKGIYGKEMIHLKEDGRKGN